MTDTQHPRITLAPDFFAKADADRARIQADQKADFQQQLSEARTQGGAYVGDGPIPPAQGALPMPPGFVGALAQYIYQHAPRPVAEVAIVGALGLMAGVAGRVWYIPKSGLNLYVVLVARSAIGKEAMHSGVNTLVQAAREFYGEAELVTDPSDFASGQALLKACAHNPCFVNLAGELGHKFALMAENRDASMRSLRKQMTTLYSKSGPDGVAGGISYSSQENNVESTQAVAFSLIGETTPGTFYESITDAMMSDGFMSRFCVIEYLGDRPARNRAHVDRPPEALVRHLATIMQHAGKASAIDVFQKVEFSPSAQSLLDLFDEECDAGIVGQDDENLRQLWNRAHLKALRVAALLAVGDQYLNPVVTEEQAAWAIALVRHGVAAFDKRIRQGDIGEGSDGGREQKVLDLCREFLLLPSEKLPSWLKHGKAMQDANIVPRRYLQQRTQRLAAFERHKLGHTAALNMAIKTAMTNGNLIEVKKEPLVEQFSFFGQAYRLLSAK
ncbi:hypothetical protein FHS51_004243 [Sphingobium wenxiniae]|uniref:Uncharacterized protein DUF3987 n=1 Tax=Sphingobium wenxiniae (strain DSM 21828 / CGMCC 1.7748 / JZ-1) TaxID=595605 RepID=A0A562JU20_SPHWJ|nr:DUF3987 domain-containing protein [Sphingobium wenxiniae]MBB6193978.1 hypothetical protein [Sphingobium wenxiniae]TWH86689.1 uncharacterized protein DUF3987 [Sphingobium wenxiniae]